MRALLGAVVLLALSAPAMAAEQPREFVHLRAKDAIQRDVTLEAYGSWSFINFSRPDRACGLQEPGIGGGFCPASDSNEMAVGVGGSLGYRFWGPFSISWGIAVARTEPEWPVLPSQTVIMMPFALVATWPDWNVRPIGELSVVGFGLLPDGVKSVMFGMRGGAAIRVGDIDIGLSVGVSTSDAMRPVEVRLSVMHLY